MKGRDIAGIVMGVPVLLLGLLVALGASEMGLYWGLVSAALLFVSVGLFVPSKSYEHGRLRAIGFVALSLSAALAAGCVVGFGINLYSFFSEWDTDLDDSLSALAVAVGCLVALAFAFLGTWVLRKKLSPSEDNLIAAIVAGIVALTLGVVLFYAWYR